MMDADVAEYLNGRVFDEFSKIPDSDIVVSTILADMELSLPPLRGCMDRDEISLGDFIAEFYDVEFNLNRTRGKL